MGASTFHNFVRRDERQVGAGRSHRNRNRNQRLPLLRLGFLLIHKLALPARGHPFGASAMSHTIPTRHLGTTGTIMVVARGGGAKLVIQWPNSRITYKSQTMTLLEAQAERGRVERGEDLKKSWSSHEN